MKVSVIIPNYNHAEYLEQRIQSILNQTFQDFEIVILDDKSTDNSNLIIEKYRTNPKVSTILYNEENSGSTFKQWEKGIALSKGEIIWMAESDDYCENNFLEILIQGLTDHPGCVLAYAQSYCIDEHNNIKWLTKCRKMEEIVDGKKFIKYHLLKGTSIVNASMAIFKKEVYASMPKDFSDFKFSGDWLFWIETARQGNVFISGRFLNFFRKHDKDVSGKAFASGYNFTENLKILGYLKKYSFINDSLYRQLIFLKYKLFNNNRNKYKPEEIASIEKDFTGMFKNKLDAKKYFLSMQLKSSLRIFDIGKKRY